MKTESMRTHISKTESMRTGRKNRWINGKDEDIKIGDVIKDCDCFFLIINKNGIEVSVIDIYNKHSILNKIKIKTYIVNNIFYEYLI